MNNEKEQKPEYYYGFPVDWFRTDRDFVFDKIFTELDRAQKKFPSWPDDPLHAVAIINEELGELTQAILEHTYEPEKSNLEDIELEAIQTAAMAIRFIMSLNKYKYEKSPQHSQVREIETMKIDFSETEKLLQKERKEKGTNRPTKYYSTDYNKF